MFGLGLPEIAVVVLVAILVFGPDKLPEVARTAGKAVRTMRAMIADAKEQLGEELGADVIEEFRDLDPRRPATPPTQKTKPTLAPGEKPPYDAEAT